MDTEFHKLLIAVRDGKIQEPHRVREIIADARTTVAAKQDAVNEMKSILFQAEEAFLLGWVNASPQV